MTTEKSDKGFTVVDRRASADPSAAAEPATPPEQGRVGPEGRRALAEIDFSTFVMSLGSSALIHLGELAPPGEATPRADLPLAKQTIDILGMLDEKTRGNLSADEARLMEHLLYDLRMKYVEAKKRKG